MAQAETPNLLARMSNDRLPVPGSAADTREPIEREESREIEQGRRPEDVVQTRERQPKEVAEPSEVPVKKWKVRGEDKTLEQIAAEGLLDKLITSAEQLPAVHKKHQELLEQLAAKTLSGTEAKAPEVPTRPAPPTAEQILHTYLPVARKAAELGHLEPDFVEAYPQHASGLMYFRDVVENDHERLEQVIRWIGAEVEIRNQRKIRSAMDMAIDRVAAKVDNEGKDDPVVARLKEPEVRKNFETWLMNEVDPKVAALTDDNMYRFWLAFNAPQLLEFAKKAADKPPVAPRTKAASDGSSSRPGKLESPAEPTLLDRMSDMRLESDA